MTEYYIPTGHSETELVEKRSRFIGQVWHVSSEEEERYSDDGEPQGTAGQPMLNVFQREEVTDVVCVVTRYFGGVLLGAGGLVRAYAKSAKDALDAAGLSVVRRWVAMEVPCTYARFEEVRREAARFGGVVEKVDYGADVLLSVLIPEERSASFAAHLLDASAGTVEALETGEQLKDVPWREPERKA